MSTNTNHNWVKATTVAEVKEKGIFSRTIGGQIIAFYNTSDGIFAVDNRCPHMGFPLDRGSVTDGILTCYWHYARFDLKTGGAFDQFADDVRAFPTDIREDEVWVDLAPHGDPHAHQTERLKVGLERDLPLVIGKAVLVLLEGGSDPVGPFRVGLEFGTRYRQGGWGQGLTMLTCLMNLIPALQPQDRPQALYHGLAAVARDSFGAPPRFPVRPLPGDAKDIATLKRWFRQFIEVRDEEGAERCLVSAVQAGASGPELADMLFAAVTDHRYIQVGHPLDFTNKALEALDHTGWDLAELVLTSLVRGYADASRMEESNSWRHPIDLIAILEDAFEQLPDAVAAGEAGSQTWQERDGLVEVLFADDPAASVEALLESLRQGAGTVDLASAVSHAAALRIARFHTSNEFSDWDTALHTFTFANAVEQGLRRAPSIELLRGVFDAAMSIYLDRFLNIPPARLPQANGQLPQEALDGLPGLLDRQQQVNQAAGHVVDYLAHAGDAKPLLAMLGKLLLREDRDFHTIQTVEAAIRQYKLLPEAESANALVAAARYLAAHSPTVRAQGQTYDIARRLHRGEKLFEG
jgi:nitrite reductase/ring-hydroxylating ferredoxin subunit